MSCTQCKHYSELKEPRVQKDKNGFEYSISGYCFRKAFQEDYHKGYAVFKQIQILCESDEYYIIEEGNSFGLSNYDHIALDGKSLNENDVVF